MTRQWWHLMESEHEEGERSQSRRPAPEGEFFGMREWRPGDSRRWIHWRTSAKLGRLAVRQFEHQHDGALALAVDLWQPRNATEDQLERVELAVSVAATIVAELCHRGGCQIALAVAGGAAVFRRGRASPLFLKEAMDWLAVVEASEAPSLPKLMEQIRRESASDTRLVVISTRLADDGSHGRQEASRRLARPDAIWVEASVDGLGPYFRM